MALSNEPERELRPPPPASRIWLHFLGLLAAAAVIATLDRLFTAGPDSSLGSALRGLHEGMYPLVPVAAGVAVGMGMTVRLRAAVQIVIVATIIMIGLDLVPQTRQVVQASGPNLTTEGQTESLGGGSDGWPTGEALKTTAKLLTGELAEWDQTLQRYDMEHDRQRAALGLMKLGLLLTPFVAAGIILGLAAWVEQRVLFRSGADELMVMIVIAWGLSPLVVYVSLNLAHNAVGGALFRGGSLGMILVAYLPSVVIGLLGWRAFSRWQRGR